MVEGNQVPGGDEIGTRRDVAAENNVPTEADRWQEDYQRTVGFQPQDGARERQQVAVGYDRSLGYDRIAVGNTALGQRIDNVTNLLAMGERSAGNLQDVNRYYGRAQKEADELFRSAAQNVISGREDYRAVKDAQSPQQVFQIVEASIQRQAQAIQQQLQQERDPARVRRLEQILAMEQERAQTLERMKQTQNPQERDRLLMYDALSAQRIDLSQRMMNERDPNEVRKMAEAEMNLHTVQRAPGFTRANYGMLLMRMGQYDPTRPDNAALRALQDAAAVDPEMIPNPNSSDPARRMGDPNFMRVASEITRMNPQDPRFAQVMAPIFNRDINRTPGPIQAAESYNPNARYSQLQEPQYQPGRENFSRPAEQTRIADQSQIVTPLVNGKTPFQRVKELGPIADAQGLTPDVRKAYADVIADSDKGVSPRAQQIIQQIVDAQKSPEFTRIVEQGQAKINALPQAERQKMAALTQQLDSTQDAAERQRLLGEMGKISPESVQAIQYLERTVKPLSDELTGELNQASATRMEFAERLMRSEKPEDKTMAKQLLIESVAKAIPEQREAFANYAMQLGLSKEELEQGLAKIPQQQVERAAVQPGAAQTADATGDRSPAGKMIDDNRKAFDAAQDKKAKLAEMKGSFQNAITAADQEMAKYVELGQARAKALNDMPAEDKAKFQKMFTESTPAAEREAIRNEFLTKYSSIVDLEKQMQALTPGEKGQPIDLAVNKFEARYEFARASNLGGDDAAAKALLTDGIKTLTRDAGAETTAMVMQDPGVAELAKKLGVNADALAKEVAAEAPAPGLETAGATGDVRGTLRVASARMQKGDIAGAKEAYESAIKMVDAAFNPEENNRKIKEAQDLLEKGNLTIEQRLQKQQEIAAYFNQAIEAYDVRSGYARVLSHPTYNQNAAAETAYKDAIAAADRVPVLAMKRQMGLLANDIGTFQTAYEQATGPKKAQIEQAQAFLSEFSNTLNGQTTGGGPAADKAWINTQVNARKDLAAFYVRLVSDFDEKGQPLLKSDGTPIYVPDASKVFKPEEGMKAIEEAKAKYKELYGTDLDQDPSKDPTMALLAKGIYDNSPPELQKKYKNATVAWDEAKAGIPTMIAGVGTALLMAKFKPLRPLIGESAVATWGSSLLAGSTAASVTHHTMMNNVLGRTDNSWERSIAIGTGTTIGGVALMKAPNFIFRNFGDDAAAQVIKRGGGGLMEFGAAEGGVASRLKTLDVLKAERAALSEGSATFAADKARLDGLIRANENRTGLINMLAGPKGKPIAEFDQALQALAQGGDKSKMVSDLGTAITKFGPQLKVAEEAPKFAEILGRNGGMTVPKEIAERFAAKGLPVIENAAGESVLAMRTPAEMRQVLAELPKIEPSLLGARNASQATKTANGMIAELDAMAKSGVAADANLSTVLANATLKNPEQINMLTAFVPEAKVAAQQVTSSGTNIFGAQQGLFSTAGSKMVSASGEGSGFGHRLLRGAGDKLINIGESKTLARAETFGSTVTSGKGAIALGTTAGFGSEAYNYSQTGEFNLANAGLKSALFAGGLYGAGKVGGFTRNSLVNAMTAERAVVADGLLARTGNRLIANAENATGFQARALNGTGQLLRGTESVTRFSTSGLGATSMGTTLGFGSEAYNYTQTGEFNLGNAAVKSALFAGGLYGAGKAGQFVSGAFKPWAAKSITELNHARFLAGTLGGTGYYAGSAYPRDWQLMYGSDGNLDPKTGKPYDLNFRNAVLSPLWKSEHDNILAASILGGAFFAKPGSTVMAQAPWANSRTVFKPPVAAWNLVTGNTWNYLGARGAALPVVGEAAPAITTNMSLRQFDVLQGYFSRNNGQQYLEPLKRAGDPITDESPEAVQKRLEQVRKQQELQRQQQQQQQQQQQEQQRKQGTQPAANQRDVQQTTEQGAATTPRPENPDLTGGVQ